MSNTTAISKKDAFIANYMKRPKADLSSNHQSIREDALQALTLLDLPTSRDEYWKYTRLTSITKQDYNHVEVKLDALQDEWKVEGLEANLMVFANGYYQPHLSNIIDQNVSILTLDQARMEAYDVVDKHFDQHVNAQNEIFTALNTAFNHTGVFVHVSKNEVVEHPIHIIDVIQGESALVVPRNLFVVDQSAKAQIIHSVVSNGGEKAFVNGVSEIVVGENASVEYQMIQTIGDTNQQIQTTQVTQANNSKFITGAFTFNGQLVRNNLNILVEGTGCETHLNGVYLLDGKMHVDNHSVVDHLMPHCESNENYKGVITDKATGVFNGKVFVRPDAQKINAFQSNQNILLSDDATINSKPELEIYADDVKCSHGSTTGQLNQEGLFYLESRGVKPQEARKLMINAFADEALSEIGVDALKEKLEVMIADRCQQF